MLATDPPVYENIRKSNKKKKEKCIRKSMAKREAYSLTCLTI
jgi:hypothetical protein